MLRVLIFGIVIYMASRNPKSRIPWGMLGTVLLGILCIVIYILQHDGSSVSDIATNIIAESSFRDSSVKLHLVEDVTKLKTDTLPHIDTPEEYTLRKARADAIQRAQYIEKLKQARGTLTDDNRHVRLPEVRCGGPFCCVDRDPDGAGVFMGQILILATGVIVYIGYFVFSDLGR